MIELFFSRNSIKAKTISLGFPSLWQNLKNDDVILRGGLRMMMVDDGGGRGVKNGRKSDDVINGGPYFKITIRAINKLSRLVTAP